MSTFQDTNFIITLVSSKGVGTTSFLSTIPTNGVNILEIPDQVLNQTLTFHIFENNEEMAPSSICLILLYDITNKSTFNYVTERFMTLKSKLSVGKSFVVLLGNKCDLDKKRAVSTQQAEIFASQHGLFFLEISTVTRKNIELVLKVMRIRTVHLLKKSQQKNGAIEPKENTETSQQQSKAMLSKRTNEAIQKNGDLPRAYNNAYQRNEPVGTTKSPRKLPDFISQSQNNEEELEKKARILMVKEENSLASRPLPSLPETADEVTPKRVFQQSSEKGKIENHSQYNKENRIDPAQAVNPFQTSVFHAQQRTSPLGDSLPQFNKPLQSKTEEIQPIHNPQFKELSPEFLKVPANPYENNNETHPKSNFSPVTSNFAAKTSQPNNVYTDLSTLTPVLHQRAINQNVEPLSQRTQNAPESQNFVSLGTLEYTGSFLLTETGQETLTFGLGAAKNSERNMKENKSIIENSERKQLAYQKPLQSLAQDFKNASTDYSSSFMEEHPKIQAKIPEQGSQVYQEKVGKESDVGMPIRKNSESGHSLTLRTEERLNLPYKESEKGMKENKRDLPLQTPQFKFGGVNESKRFDLPNKQDNNNKITEDTCPNVLTLEEENILTKRENYQTLASEYDNHVSPKEHGEIEGEKDYEIDVIRNQGPNSYLRSSKVESIKGEDPIDAIDKDIKLLEESLLNINTNLSYVGGSSERAHLRRKSITSKQGEDNQEESLKLKPDDILHKAIKASATKKQRKKSFENKTNSEDVEENVLKASGRLSTDRKRTKSLNTSHMKTDMSTILPEKDSNNLSNVLLTSQRTEKNEIPLLYVQIEDENERTEFVPVYSYDDSFSVAERFCKLKNLQFNWPQFRAIAMLIETKINNTAQSLEAMIANRENQSFEYPNMSRSFGSQKIKETRAGGHSSIRNVQSVYNEEIYIGKVYVELDNKKVIVLNVKENDDPNTTAIRFLSDNNLTRKHYSAIVDQIRMIKNQWKSQPGMESCIVKNLVLKENKGIPTFRKNSIPDKFSRSKSPIKSTSFLFDTKARPQIANNSLNENNNRVLFRLNFDIGKGKMAKFTFKEKDNVAKAVQHFTITHKLSSKAYQRIFEIAEKTLQNKLKNSETVQNLESLIFKAE